MAQFHRVQERQARLPCRSASTMARRHAGRHGHTLVELSVVMIVIGVLASFGVPRFVHSLEQSRVDMAATSLRAIWTAQRLYWLKHQTYAPDLNSLYSDPVDGENFLAQPGAVDPNQPCYVCTMTSESTTDFQATATRSPSASWSGGLSISSNGVVAGSVTGPDGYIYHPTPIFQ